IYKSLKGDANKVWYERGEELVKAIRKVIIIYGGKPVVQVSDTFENVSKADFIIDWGYHLTFYPEDGSKLIIPSKIVEERSESELPEDIETWRPAEKEKTRTEVGILHKSLKKESVKDTTISKILLKHISKNNLSVSFKECPYFQSWICNGGANSTEFTFTESKKPVFEKNWDGIGIELGSSALDHNGNTDPEVTISFNLKPGESYTNFIEIKVLDDEEAKKLEKEIRDFQTAS
ncbi:MAG: hypothetical protein GXO89_01585, partial [Chlorobi bacterium]|nr:hypothetical protein [Chlorobiota bacterium]